MINYFQKQNLNYLNLNAELFITEDISKNEYVGGMFRHLASYQDVKDTELNSTFSTTSIDATYGSRDKDLSYNIDLGYKNQMNNWYGIPTKYVAFDETTINSINEKQSFNTIQLGGKFGMRDAFLDNASLLFKNFSLNIINFTIIKTITIRKINFTHYLLLLKFNVEN